MAIAGIIFTVLKGFFSDILYVFIRDFLAGFRDSLYGFFYIHKLENALPPRPPVKEETKRSTVLSLRRLREEKAAIEAEKPAAQEIVRKKASGPKLVFQCILVNFSFTIVLYYLIIPFLQLVYGLIDTEWPGEWFLYCVRKCFLGIANIICCSFYIPLYLFMKVFNGIWCLDVSNAALRYTNVHSMKFPSFAYGVGDMVVGLLVELLFMIQTWLVTWIDFPLPVIGHTIHFIHLSLLYSLFSYEYVWMAKGVKVTVRLDKIERDWAYYLGFGAIMAVVGMIWTSFIFGYLVFGMCFPFFIVSAYVTDDNREQFVYQTLPPLHLFWPSLVIANRISDTLANAVNRRFKNEVEHYFDKLREARMQQRSSSLSSVLPGKTHVVPR